MIEYGTETKNVFPFSGALRVKQQAEVITLYDICIYLQSVLQRSRGLFDVVILADGDATIAWDKYYIRRVETAYRPLD